MHARRSRATLLTSVEESENFEQVVFDGLGSATSVRRTPGSEKRRHRNLSHCAIARLIGGKRVRPRTLRATAKARQGEFTALRELDDVSRTSLTPLIEVAPRAWDFENETFQKNLDEHIRKIPRQIADSWGTSRRIFVDAVNLDPADRTTTGRHPLEHIFADARTLALMTVPVTGPERDAEYQSAVRSIAREGESGVCVRLSRADLTKPDRVASLPGLVASLGLGLAQADLVLDLEAVTEAEIDVFRAFLSALHSTIPRLTEWRTYTILSGAFPLNLGELGPGIGSLPRADWLMWRQFVRMTPSSTRLPTFGDYAIQHPEPKEIDPRIMQMSANIRYTHQDEWIIFRGKSIRLQGSVQYRSLSRQIVDSAYFAGRTHCAGDERIRQCADGAIGVGNATTWRTVGTNHHLKCVMHQVASLFGA